MSMLDRDALNIFIIYGVYPLLHLYDAFSPRLTLSNFFFALPNQCLVLERSTYKPFKLHCFPLLDVTGPILFQKYVVGSTYHD